MNDIDNKKFLNLYEYANGVDDPMGLSKSTVCKIMDINATDFYENLEIIYSILKNIHEEKSKLG